MKKGVSIIIFMLIVHFSKAQLSVKTENTFRYGQGKSNTVVTFCSCNHNGDTLSLYTVDRVVYKKQYQACNKVQFYNLEPGLYYANCGNYIDSLYVPFTDAILIKKEN